MTRHFTLLALAALAPAQGRDVTVDGFEPVEIVRILERYAGVHVEVDEAVARRRVTLRLERARPETALRWAAFAADARAGLRERRFHAGEPRDVPPFDLIARLREVKGLDAVVVRKP